MRASDRQKLLVYFDDEQHLIRRIGAAVISCWHDLPSEARYMLFQRSILICDDQETERLEEQFRRFIAEHSRLDVVSLG